MIRFCSFPKILTLFLVYALVGCSSSPKEAEIQLPAKHKSITATVGIETSQVAAEQNADFVIELVFRKKDVELSKENQVRFRDFLSRAFKKGEVSEIKVISWADVEYPSSSQKKLPGDQQKISNDRNKSIKSFILGMKQETKVETFSMAERANSLKEFIGTSEARVKNSLELAGIPTTESPIKFPSKASKSIILIMMK